MTDPDLRRFLDLGVPSVSGRVWQQASLQSGRNRSPGDRAERAGRGHRCRPRFAAKDVGRHRSPKYGILARSLYHIWRSPEPYHHYARLMEHWRSVLPSDRLLEIEYEELVADRETATRRLIAFTGLDWNDSCLHPEHNQRTVTTASLWQARQPVYTTSVARWRRYEPWLGELRRLLPPACNAALTQTDYPRAGKLRPSPSQTQRRIGRQPAARAVRSPPRSGC